MSKPDPHLAGGSESDAAGRRTELQEFLYDKRLDLFNTRREHEWKIYFGTIALLGALDLSVLSGHVPVLLRPPDINNGFSLLLFIGWVFICAAICRFCIGYESHLQERNADDRQAMDTIFNELCTTAGYEDKSCVRERPGKRNEDAKRGDYHWAFEWQKKFLLRFAGLSILIPVIPNDVPQKPSNEYRLLSGSITNLQSSIQTNADQGWELISVLNGPSGGSVAVMRKPKK
jgi:hypothetical protein